VVIAQENKCAMRGKDAIGRGKHDNDNKEMGTNKGNNKKKVFFIYIVNSIRSGNKLENVSSIIVVRRAGLEYSLKLNI
jgi:hypothetical protein